jgi:hypothetical protein
MRIHSFAPEPHATLSHILFGIPAIERGHWSLKSASRCFPRLCGGCEQKRLDLRQTGSRMRSTKPRSTSIILEHVAQEGVVSPFLWSISLSLHTCAWDYVLDMVCTFDWALLHLYNTRHGAERNSCTKELLSSYAQMIDTASFLTGNCCASLRDLTLGSLTN